MNGIAFLTWSRYSLGGIVAISLFTFIYIFALKKYFLRKYDPEFRYEFDAIYPNDADTGNLRLGYYIKGMTLPNRFIHEVFTRKSIKQIASLPDRVIAFSFCLSVFASIISIVAWYIPYLSERMEIVDLGIGHWGPQGRLDSGGFAQIVIDDIIDYAAWIIHSPAAAVLNFAVIGFAIALRVYLKRHNYR